MVQPFRDFHSRGCNGEGMDHLPDVSLDLTPLNFDCLRCGTTAPMRFRGLCGACRDELHDRFAREEREVEVAEYEPKINVTPNAVATKD